MCSLCTHIYSWGLAICTKWHIDESRWHKSCNSPFIGKKEQNWHVSKNFWSTTMLFLLKSPAQRAAHVCIPNTLYWKYILLEHLCSECWAVEASERNLPEVVSLKEEVRMRTRLMRFHWTCVKKKSEQHLGKMI